MHAGFVPTAGEQLGDTHFVRNLLKWLFRVSDGKRHQNGPRPGRNLVDIEPEPIGKQHNLWRNRGNCVVIVLTKKAEIDLGEGIDLCNSTHLENLLAGMSHSRMVRHVSRKL